MKIQVVQKTQRLDDFGAYFGLEVPEGFACLQDLAGNMDPQHGGGCWIGESGVHFGREAISAAGAATAIHYTTDPDVTFVTPRLDPDALVAGLLLSGLIPRGTDAVKRLDRLDTGTMYDSWAPEFRVQTVGDDPQWGPLAALCMQYPRVSIDVLIASVRHICCGADAPAEYIAAHAAHTAAWQKAQCDILPRVTRVGTLVARGVDLPFVAGSGAMAAAYAIAPVAALSTTVSGKRKHTLAVANGWEHGPEVIRRFKAHVDTNESGWGGSSSIIGSPFAGTTVPDEVFEQMVLHVVRLATGTV